MMASERRLIDANAFHAFLEDLRQDYLAEDSPSSALASAVIETVQDVYLANALTVDAVEVVRCKDCKWRNTCGCPYMHFNAVARDDLDFCSDGERSKHGI